jgi:hypothetical protein
VILHPDLDAAVKDLLELSERGRARADVKTLALIVADLVAHLGATDKEALGEILPGLRVDHLLESIGALEARIRVLELALTETNRRIPGQPETPPTTLFGIPVALIFPATTGDVAAAVETLGPGLSRDEVVDALQEQGLLRRVEAGRR